ncbi:SAF domain-containing protein [Phycicoccus duodecadis]|uniref:Flp pilus assembly protein CpaB n=1 Tax=Phycicoccus duodecadis TaxID=173053 RepID=A0A2N3YKY8_9MICO|nr:SAF domain-containing protein [Phycicoccus duodecadis]PKW27504.1 Flp pilus assembly protein CpaB [Phycicoccus duodecadis]
MVPLARPFPGLTGRGRRARWRRGVLRRVLAALCAAGAVALGVRELRPPPPPSVGVVVAARSVPAGAVLSPADLALVPVALDARQPGAVLDPASAVGRRLAAPLAAGEAVTLTRLVPRRAGEGLPPGAVALHVLLADPAAADLLSAGRRVAVYNTAGGVALAHDATVLSVDPAAASRGSVLSDTSAGPRGVVLALESAGADRVLAGHGGLDGGPPVVALVLLG